MGKNEPSPEQGQNASNEGSGVELNTSNGDEAHNFMQNVAALNIQIHRLKAGEDLSEELELLKHSLRAKVKELGGFGKANEWVKNNVPTIPDLSSYQNLNWLKD